MIEGPHFVGDLQLTELLVTEGRCISAAPLAEPSLGVLLTIFDVGASHPAMIASRPNWTATQDVAMHSTAQPIRVGPIVVDSELLRVGKKTVVAHASVYDGAGQADLLALHRAIEARTLTLAASGVITFARIPRAAAPGMDHYDPADWVGQPRLVSWSSSASGSLHERLGLTVLDAHRGRLELEAGPYVTNSIGTIQGGAIAVLLEAAALAMRPDLVASDMQVHYLAQVKVGPARTSGRVLRDAVGHSVVTLKVEDAGNGELLARATVILSSRPDC